MSDMSEDNKSLDASAGAESGANGANVALRNSLVTRRRFAKAGAASSVVLGSLVAKPVLAYTDKQIYHCTVSGKLSGNFSSHPDNTVVCKNLGKSPAAWSDGQGWPGAVRAGTLNDINICSKDGTTPGASFNGFVGGSSKFIDAFKFKTSNCTVYNLKESAFGTCTANATMLQILKSTRTNGIASFGRATVASLLNALKGSYPLTPNQVIDMFNAVANGGTYKLNTTKSWSMAEVQTYFESLYA